MTIPVKSTVYEMDFTILVEPNWSKWKAYKTFCKTQTLFSFVELSFFTVVINLQFDPILSAQTEFLEELHYDTELENKVSTTVFYLFGLFRPTREFFTHLDTSPLPVKGTIFNICSALMAIEQCGF